jgi:hypothetical protein
MISYMRKLVLMSCMTELLLTLGALPLKQILNFFISNFLFFNELDPLKLFFFYVMEFLLFFFKIIMNLNKP